MWSRDPGSAFHRWQAAKLSPPNMQTLTRFDHIWTSVTLKRPWTRATPAFKFCTSPSEPVIPSKKPFKVDVVGGKRYSWCTCGYSKKQPFCDGAHKLKAPSFTPLRFFPDKDMTIYLCGCKYTNNPPYCDGTHKHNFIASAPLYEEKDS